jgi:hypothetical protein
MEQATNAAALVSLSVRAGYLCCCLLSGSKQTLQSTDTIPHCGRAGVTVSDSDWEVEFRRRRFAQLRTAYDQSPDRIDEEQLERDRAIERPKAAAFLSAFEENGDLDKLRHSLDSWSKTTGKQFGFKGPNGQMYLNQLTNDGEALGVGERLAEWLPSPTSEQQASRRIDELAALTADLRKQGSAAQIARAPFLLSWIWWIQEPIRGHRSGLAGKTR